MAPIHIKEGTLAMGAEASKECQVCKVCKVSVTSCLK